MTVYELKTKTLKYSNNRNQNMIDLPDDAIVLRWNNTGQFREGTAYGTWGDLYYLEPVRGCKESVNDEH